MGIYGDGWKNLNIRAWKTWLWFSSRLENLKRGVKPCKWHFLGDFTPFFVFLWPTKGVGLRQPKVFLFHLFKYTFALSAKRLFSGTWVGLFQASVCSGDHSVAISLSSNLELERTSTSATCLHWSYFMSTRKAAFWIQERILFQFLKKGTFGAPECLSNISIYLLCKSYKKVCYMKHLPLHSPFY